MEFTDYFNQVLAAETLEELYGLLMRAVEEICGFNRATFRLLTDHNLINLPANHGISKNYPDDWMVHYLDKGYEKIDPVSKYGLQSSLPFSWKQVEQTVPFNKAQKDCFYGGIEAGLNHGVAIPLRSAHGQVAGVAAAVDRHQKDFDENHQIAMMNLVCQHFYLRFLQLHEHNPTHLMELPPLTNNEREVMRWMSRGLNSEEIGDVLNMSKGTVEWYFNEIRRKYNAKNRTIALMYALHKGEVDLNELYVTRKPGKKKSAA